MKSAKYADNTTVSIERSRAEIESLVRKYGAQKFASSWDKTSSVIMFVCNNRLVRFQVQLPTDKDAETTEKGYTRHEPKGRDIWKEKEERRRWRSLCLCIKAKLEAVSSTIETFDEAFLSHIVTDDKTTVYERLFKSGSSIKMLPPVAIESTL